MHLAYPRVYTNAAATASSLLMLRAVLDVCRLLKIRLVFVSSWVVFSGYPSTGMAVDETMPWRPKGVYAETKYLEETLVALHAQRGDIQCSICRFTPVYGPGSDRPRLIRTFEQAARRGETIKTHLFRNGRPALDLLHVSDASTALAAVVASESDDVFHFGTGDLRSTAELASMIARSAGVSVKTEEMPIDDDTSNIAFPAEKARRVLGWAPGMTIERGLASMIEGHVPDA